MAKPPSNPSPRTVHFAVAPRLAALLGETYHSTEAALKELVDNAWDADAVTVSVTLPAPMTSGAIVISDDGQGMSAADVESEYLNIARDRRSLKGDATPRLKRRVKGKKGIGKFAGLAAAKRMQLRSVRDGQCAIVEIDKDLILAAEKDIERIPLPLIERAAPDEPNGTLITLTELDANLNFPNPDSLRALLYYEYGRATGFTIFVNGTSLDVEDLPGDTVRKTQTLPHAGEVAVRFTIAEGKTPKHAGFVLRVGGKVVGKPQWFGPHANPDIPERLRKRLYGEIAVEGIEGVVTSDWGAIIENSKAFDAISAHVNAEATAALKSAYSREMRLHSSRLNQEINRRLEKLPKHRRAFAEAALGRLLVKFYGERQERIDTVAAVILDAMERDEYWQVLQKIDAARHGDVADFADALEQFGLVELTLMAERAKARMHFLGDIDSLVANPATREAEVHKALEKNLWVLGSPFHFMASNSTLARIVDEYGDKKFVQQTAANRPDLLLSTDPGDRYLLIEFKRPSHPISRQDEAQAQGYADDLRTYLPSKPIDVLVVGGRRIIASNPQNDPPNLRVASYADIISRARYEVEWLLKSTNL